MTSSPRNPLVSDRRDRVVAFDRMTPDERGTVVKAIAAAALTWALDDIARESDDPSTLIHARSDDDGR